MMSKKKIWITPRILITLYKGHLPIAWGHIDFGEGKCWLGVSVAEGYGKKGNGSKIVKNLCEFADRGGLILWLTCRNELVKWYEKFGFEVTYIDKVVYMRRK